VSAWLSSFNATLLDAGGRKLGWITHPDVHLVANQPATQHIRSYLTVIDAEAFREESQKLLAGRKLEWSVRGQTILRALGLPFAVTMRKRLDFEGARLDNFRARNVQIVSANASAGELYVDAEISFSSVSALEFLNMGTLEVELWYNPIANDPHRPGYGPASRRALGSRLCTPAMSAAGACGAGWEVSERIGTALFYGFKVRRGAIGSPRQPSLRASIRLWSSETSGRVAGRWAAQHEQSIISLGPINKAAYLDRVWQGLVHLDGSPVRLLTGALGSRETFVRGYDSQTGQECDVYRQGAEHCDKGALVMAHNPFHRRFALHSIEYDVYFEEQFEYDATFRVEALGLPLDLRAVSCAPTDAFARMRSKPGMWAFAPNHQGPDGAGYTGDAAERRAARLADEAVPFSPGGEAGAGTVPFFLTAFPMPGNAERTNRDGNTGPCVLGIATLDPFDCCEWSWRQGGGFLLGPGGLLAYGVGPIRMFVDVLLLTYFC